MEQKPIKILHQPLKAKWYRMIKDEKKTEEYRAYTVFVSEQQTKKQKNMKKKNLSLQDMAVRLCEGGVVEYQGHFLRAGDYYGDDNPCLYCNMDSICNPDMTDLCAECDGLTHSKHILILAYEKRLKAIL